MITYYIPIALNGTIQWPIDKFFIWGHLLYEEF